MRIVNYIVVIVLSIIIIFSCRKDDYYAGDDIALRFSVDTLTFDTVFTEVGSATRVLKVYNDNEQPILFSTNLRQSNSVFRLNVNGQNGTQFSDIEIRANDSVYIFAEVTVNPDMPLSVSPFIIEEYIDFEVNNNDQELLVEAWGQNANYIPKSRIFDVDNINICESMGKIVWDDPKPYVLYGIILIDGCELEIPAGTQVYVHGGFDRIDGQYFNSGLILVSKNGKLTVKGTLEEPVVFQGDRLEEEYEDQPGQWSGIRLLEESKGNTFEFVTIKNSIIGVRVDSLADMRMSSSQIYNTSSSGLLSVQGNTEVENSLFYNNAENAAQITFGGTHDFKYCTFANYLNDKPAVNLNNFQCYDPPFCSNTLAAPLNASFTNCIIAGSNNDELWMTDITDGQPGAFNFGFDHCILEIEELLETDNYPNFFDFAPNSKTVQFDDPLFIDYDEDDYHLDTLSIADQMGLSLPTISQDIEGNPRDVSTPDVGCYERID